MVRSTCSRTWTAPTSCPRFAGRRRASALPRRPAALFRGQSLGGDLSLGAEPKCKAGPGRCRDPRLISEDRNRSERDSQSHLHDPPTVRQRIHDKAERTAAQCRVRNVERRCVSEVVRLPAEPCAPALAPSEVFSEHHVKVDSRRSADSRQRTACIAFYVRRYGYWRWERREGGARPLDSPGLRGSSGADSRARVTGPASLDFPLASRRGVPLVRTAVRTGGQRVGPWMPWTLKSEN